jgi:hypothetical protein
MARDAQSKGFQLAIHAIGDQAVRETIDAIEYALDGESNLVHRHRIEHASITPAGLPGAHGEVEDRRDRPATVRDQRHLDSRPRGRIAACVGLSVCEHAARGLSDHALQRLPRRRLDAFAHSIQPPFAILGALTKH